MITCKQCGGFISYGGSNLSHLCESCTAVINELKERGYSHPEEILRSIDKAMAEVRDGNVVRINLDEL